MTRLSVTPAAHDAAAVEAEGLVDEAQTLRLSFRDAPLAGREGGREGVDWGEWIEMSVFLANEFGLWRRADFPMVEEGERERGGWLPVCFSVLDHGSGYCEISRRVGVEVVGLPSQMEDEGEEEEEEEEGREGGRRVAFRKGSSCRLRVRLRFILLENGVPAAAAAAAASASSVVVHLKVSLPSEKLTREVLPVYSLPIHISSSSTPLSLPSSSSPSSSAALGIHSCRGVFVPSLHRLLLVAESPGQVGIGGKIWDAGLVLTQYLAANPEVIGGGREGGREEGVVETSGVVAAAVVGGCEGRKGGREGGRRRKRCRVIELGAGTGIAGIAASLLGASHVVVTDLPYVVPLIQTNIDLNVPLSLPSSASSSCIARAYAWGEDTGRLFDEEEGREDEDGREDEPKTVNNEEEGREDEIEGKFDVILLADVVYAPKYYSALVKALRELSHSKTIITFAHRERHPDCALFFAEADREFARKTINFHVEGEGGREGGQGGGRGAKAACQDVIVYEMRLKGGREGGKEGGVGGD